MSRKPLVPIVKRCGITNGPGSSSRPERSPGGHRLYDDRAVHALRLIKAAKRLRLRGDGGLLVEGKSPGIFLAGVDAGHESDECGLVLFAVGTTGVDEDRVIFAQGDQPFVGNVIGPPRGRVVERVDDCLTIEGLTVGP